MKKSTRKILAISLSACVIVGVVMGVNAIQKNKEYTLQGGKEINIDVMDLYTNPKNYPDTVLDIYDDTKGYINAVNSDLNMSIKDKELLVKNTIDTSSIAGNTYQYAKITEKVSVTKKYSVYPYFYVKLKNTAASFSFEKVIAIEGAGLNREHKGSTKQFVGTFYYNLEGENAIYWDLNGDYYNYGETIYSKDEARKDGEANTIYFLPHTSNSHYKYKQQSGRYYLKNTNSNTDV